jgi:peptide/nickel transport system permease protein
LEKWIVASTDCLGATIRPSGELTEFMHKYILRRLLLVLPTLIGVTVFVFGMVRLLPGDAVSIMLQDYSAYSYAKDEEDLRARLGIDRPFVEQYVTWFGNVMQGNLGVSLRSQKPIADDLKTYLPVTFELGALGLVVSLLISIPLGVYSAVRQDSILDYFARSTATAMLAIPGFWLGTLAITLPSIWWSWSPPLRYTPLFTDPVRNLTQMLLPAVILGIGLSGTMMRLTRTQMLEVLRQDYIRTARSKGLGERGVVFRHALKNGMIPVLTLLGLQLAVLIGGTVVLENVFAIPGMGRYLLDAISNRDYPIVQAVILVFATLIIFSNLVIDILYAWLDPNIRYT